MCVPYISVYFYDLFYFFSFLLFPGLGSGPPGLDKDGEDSDQHLDVVNEDPENGSEAGSGISEHAEKGETKPER